MLEDFGGRRQEFQATSENSSGDVPIEFFHPQIRLSGAVGNDMLADFRGQIAQLDPKQTERVVVELMTMGGDAEVARLIADEVRLARQMMARPFVFFGKAVVYSAGVTIMSAFPPQDRWLARGTRLLIHGRSMTRTLNVDGPLHAERARVQALLAEIDVGLALENEGFALLVKGTSISLENLKARARTDWYLDAEEALQSGLVGHVI